MALHVRVCRPTNSFDAILQPRVSAAVHGGVLACAGARRVGEGARTAYLIWRRPRSSLAIGTFVDGARRRPSTHLSLNMQHSRSRVPGHVLFVIGRRRRQSGIVVAFGRARRISGNAQGANFWDVQRHVLVGEKAGDGGGFGREGALGGSSAEGSRVRVLTEVIPGLDRRVARQFEGGREMGGRRRRRARGAGLPPRFGC